MSSPRILIADDDPDLHGLLRDILRVKAWDVEFVQDGRQAIERLSQNRFHIVILDIYMPGFDGLEVMQEMQKKGIETRILLMTGYGAKKGTLQKAVQAARIGAIDILEKPFGKDIFLHTIENLLGDHSPKILADRLDAFLKIHAFEPLLKMDDLARQFRITPRYVARLFKEHLGTSFRKRLIHYRVQMAKPLLESTDTPLYDIAEQCGFRNYRRLTAAFQRLEGIPPRKYREISSCKHTKYR